MKTAKMIFAALALAALMTSCVKEAEVSESLETGIKMEFTASWAEGEASRTVVAEDGAHIIWSVGEQINVFYGTQFDGVFTSTNTEPAAIVTFQGMLNILTGSLDDENIQRLYWAIYPYNENNTCDGKSVTLSLSCNQIGSSGTFADKFFPAVACGSTPDLAFYNVCGCVRFSVVREGVQKVVFSSNDGSPMAGTVCVGFGDDNKPQVLGISDAEDYIVVNAPEGGFVPGENYFATMLPQDHKEGITVTLYTASKKAIKTIDNPVTFNRSTYKKLDNADEGLEYTDLCEIVDLGLSVKWASCNIGASAPEEYGDWFAWGEVEPKENYSWETYKWCMGSESTLTKYCPSADYGYDGFTDDKTVLDPEDDAATVNWGDGWRMPTTDEFSELVDECTWEWTTLNGVYGAKFTSNKEGYTNNWIFLPAALSADTSEGLFGDYWTSSLVTYSPYFANYLFFNQFSNYYLNSYYRYGGRSVRPVYQKLVHVTGVSVSPESATVSIGEPLQLTAAITPDNATDMGLEWSSSDESVATVSYAGVVTGIAAGTVVITVTTVDGGYTASCTVTVEKDETVYVFKEDFEDSSTLGGWWSFDADGDGYNWDYINSSQFKTHSGTGVMSSASWYDGQALTPDNWLFTPAINFTTDNYLSFWTCGQDPNYPQDFYAVYITDQEPSAEMLGSCEELYHETLPDGDMHQHIIQIPAGYANKKGYIAFRHYNCTDWLRVNLDDVVISEGAPATASSVSATTAHAPRLRLLSVPFQKDRANQEILNSRRGDVRERRALR